MSVIGTSKDALSQAKSRMEKAVEDFKKDLSGVRTGRANVSLLDHVRVDYHGTMMPLNQLGTLSVPALAFPNRELAVTELAALAASGSSSTRASAA